MKKTYLIVPGYTNSGQDHWQSFMERKYTNVTRVMQDDWDNPAREAWIEKLERTIADTQGDIVLLGHSCGAVTVAQWSATHSCERVKALILVAPADVDDDSAIREIQQQRPLPTKYLNVPSLFICSDNDLHLSLPRAQKLAALWGSEMKIIPGAGHIHTAAGYGEWLLGEALFEDFTGMKLTTSGTKN